jgi:large subunit ribosomal protein L3
MSLRILGKKLGMTQIFVEEGKLIPVTVVEAGPNYVLQKKTVETDGYDALQLGFMPKRAKNTPKPLQGHFKKAGFNPLRYVRESRMTAADLDNYNVGDEINADVFAEGEYVDVIGVSKGRGFAGVIKRHGMHGTLSLTHGAHEVMRHAGSIGQSATPARVFKGKRMAGRMGTDRKTIQNLKIIGVRNEENLLLIKGAIPGPNGGLVLVQKAHKK